ARQRRDRLCAAVVSDRSDAAGDGGGLPGADPAAPTGLPRHQPAHARHDRGPAGARRAERPRTTAACGALGRRAAPRAARARAGSRTGAPDSRRAGQRTRRRVRALARRDAGGDEARAANDDRHGLARHRSRAPHRRSGDAARPARPRRRQTRRRPRSRDRVQRHVCVARQAGAAMTAFYAWIAQLAGRGLLPSDFQYPFLIRGFLCVLVLAPILGGLSHLVVTRRMAFFSAALGQAALTGVAIGLLLGEPLNAPYGGMFGFCLLSTLAMVY